MAPALRLVPIALAALLGIAAAQFRVDVPVDTRSLDEIYAAAQDESGALIVASGGDGMTLSQTQLVRRPTC